MENETTPPGDAAPARFQFHLALLSVFFPAMWLLAAALAAFHKNPGPAGPEQRKWKRYLTALLLVDLLVFACYGWMVAHPERLEPPLRESDKPRIGVVWDPDPEKTEARVRKVLPSSPAERAGFREGDLIVKIDGDPISSRVEAAQAIQSGGEGIVRTVTVERDGASIDLPVAPAVPHREKRGLFEPRPSERSVDWIGGVVSFLPALGVVGIAVLMSRRRRAEVAVWRGFLLASLGSFGAALGTALLFRALQGGLSLGATLVMMLVQMATLLGLTRLATVWCGREVPPPPDPLPPLAPVRAAFLGIYYLLTCVSRVSLILWTADQILLRGSTAGRTQSLELLATSPLGLLGTILFVSAVVFLGPLAEESLFRGFLVPRLAAMWGSLQSIVVSAVLFALFHPFYGLFMPIVFVYGFVFAWARLRTGGIVVPFVLHLAVNGLVSVVMLLR